MSQTEFLVLSLKGLLAWLVLSALGWYVGEELGQCLLHWLDFIVNLVCPDYSYWLSLTPKNHDYTFYLNALVVQPVHLGGKQWLTVGQEMTAGTQLMHTLVPVVIELSILLVWPVTGWRERLMILVLGVITAVFVVGLTAPFVLLGNLEIYLQEMAVEAQVKRLEPWYLTWMIFCEMGGRWVLPILAAFLCIRLQHYFSKKMPVSSVSKAGAKKQNPPVATQKTPG